MEKIKNKCKEIIYDKNLYIFSIITIIFFGAFCFLQYAPDTYSVFTQEIKNSVLHFFSCGRYVTGIATILAMKILNLTNKGTYYLSYIFALICTIISLYKLNKLLRNEIKNDILSIIVTTILLINPFSIELYIYIEKGIMVLSVLLCILAVERIDNYFKGNKMSIIWAMILMFIANSCYQGTVGLFVAISLIYIIKYSKNVKEFIVNNIIIALVYGIPAILNFLSVRFLFSNSRVNGNLIFSESIQKVLDGSKNMIIHTYNILPKYVFAISILVVFVIIIYKSIRDNVTVKQKILKILGAIYIIAGAFLATVAPQLLQDTASIWFVARSSYPMAAVIGILLIYTCIEFDISKILAKSIIVLSVLFLIIQFCNFVRFEIDHYIGNYMDKLLSLEISNIMQKYEEQTGNKIDTLSIYKDAETTYVYPGLNASGDMNIKAYSADWCVPGILELYTGRDFKIVENNENLEQEFKNKNWNNFEKEQIIFKDNVMHLCTF